MSQQDRSGGRPDRPGPRPGASRRSGGRPGGSANATGAGKPGREERGRRPEGERTSGQRLTPTSPRRPEPAIAEGVTGKELDRSVWTQLRTLSKENAEGVAQHLVMAGLLLDTELDAAQAHAETAVRRAGRVPAAREALGLVAYRQGDWAKALAEFRTVRRLSGSSHLLPLMVDAERALGRPDRALELAATPEARTLARDERVELAIVVSGIRRDQGQLDAAVAGLRIPELDPSRRKPWSARLFYAYADALLALGDRADAREWFRYAVDADETLETDAAERVEELDGVQQVDLLEDEHSDEPSHRG
jgi:tetratricopeptide (TPR) repeat protein